ncbi:hypothetical protein N9W71_04070, partial [Planktomarina temperata]|nr:hypothetical protein [Planktomarina temperata]
MRISVSSDDYLSYCGFAVIAFLAPYFVLTPSPAAALTHYEPGRAFAPADCTEPVVATAIGLTFNTVKTGEDADHEDQLTFEYGAAGAVCELLFGASVWSQHRNPVIQAGANILKSNDGYKAIMSADKKTQQALVKDSLQKWFNMDAEGISAAMAQLAAQEKKQEEKENDAAEEAANKKAADDAANEDAADDAFAVFDMTAEEAKKKKAADDAAKKKAAEEAVSRFLACDDCQTEYKLENVNTQTYVDANGNKGTLWCNPGPCESGSSLKHGFVTGVGTLMPLKLVEDVTKTLGEPLTKEIFNKTKDALLASAGTSDDPKLKSAAAMTTAQIKSNQVANEKSQEDKSGNLVVVVEAPVEEAP